MSFSDFTLKDFVVESNRIEGIRRDAGGLAKDVAAHAKFVGLKEVHVDDLVRLVSALQPGAKLRSEPGMDVRVGIHIAPRGGPRVVQKLEKILAVVNKHKADLNAIKDEALLMQLENQEDAEKCVRRYQAARRVIFANACDLHHNYEYLHPFMDGNGRSGRALWLLCRGGIVNCPLGFLHTWYYSSLDRERRSVV